MEGQRTMVGHSRYQVISGLLLGIVVTRLLTTAAFASSSPEETKVTMEVMGGQNVEAFRRRRGTHAEDLQSLGSTPGSRDRPDSRPIASDHFVAQDQRVSLQCMPVITNVASGISRSRRKSVVAQTPGSLFGEYLDPTRQYVGIASELDVSEDFRKTPVSSIPTLLFSGTLDGRTVAQEQREATSGPTRATRITVENAGHNLFDSVTPELLSALDQFMTNRPVDPTTIVVALPRFTPDDR